MRELTRAEAKVCFKLYREGCFGSHWLLKDTAASGFPSHELDAAKAAIDELVRDGILREKPTQHGEGVFINPKIKNELYERIREHDGFEWLPK
ncbi:hypothetical protein BRD56_05760 [Thermoplasmatales archaeon SW_10_69_26]|nr:MAG: hypothetical protein BRD56_05760 [Thermoplasmatales archaeon SW_10_69_26]